MQWQSNKKTEQKQNKVTLFQKTIDKCDPPYDFRDKGNNTLTTCFHLKTKEIDFITLTKHARAHFNEPMLLSHRTHLKQ